MFVFMMRRRDRRRYRRQDEIGTPFGITVDFETSAKRYRARETVTCANGDSMKQERVAIKDLANILISRLADDLAKFSRILPE